MYKGVEKAAATSSRQQLQNMLKRAVQTVKWTYSIYWKLCTLQRILVWSEGYYNGEIKTRKTVNSKEVSTEEASLQRSQQLRDLFESLCAAGGGGGAGENNNQKTRRPPSAALLPEDLTESEWFYLMCFSYFFPPGVGLPGRAYASRQHVWLTGANEVGSHIFSRALLAKSSEIQTVVCIPLLEGVVELGTTLKVKEDVGFIQWIMNIFMQSSKESLPPPKPALSEHSTCYLRPPSSTGIVASPAAASVYITTVSPQVRLDTGNQTEQVYKKEGRGDEEEAALQLLKTHRTSNNDFPMHRLDDDSNDDMDSDYHILSKWESGEDRDYDPSRLDLSRLPHSPPEIFSFDELAQEDTHYFQTTVSIILQGRSSRCSDVSSATNSLHHSPHSVFFKWSYSDAYSISHHQNSGPSSSQSKLKYILYTVPFLHSKDSGGTSQKPSSSNPPSRFHKDGTSKEVVIGGGNRVLAERCRREKLNERFITLRSLVPFVTKFDKASILGDTIEYVKQLRKKIVELEARVKQIEGSKDCGQSMIKTNLRLMDRESGGGKQKVDTGSNAEAAHVEVSIIENSALVKLQCRYREGLLLDIIQILNQLRVEITTVQSSVSTGVFMAELRAKVKENFNGKTVTIMEVKKAILQTVSPQHAS